MGEKRELCWKSRGEGAANEQLITGQVKTGGRQR